MRVFWSRSLRRVQGTWKTPEFELLGPLLVELQPPVGVKHGFFSDPAPGRTSGNRGNIEKQVPRPSEEGHGARSGESDVGRCGQAACVVTAVYSSTAVGAFPRTKQPQNHPECGG